MRGKKREMFHSQVSKKKSLKEKLVQEKVKLDKKHRNVRNGVEMHWVGMLGGG